MKTYRKAAVIVGVLLLSATVASIAGSALTGSILEAPDSLVKISANENRIIVGALLAFIAAATAASVAIFLYPVLKKYNESLALGSVGFRLIEGVFYSISVIGLLSLVALSQEFVKAGAPATSSFQTLSVVIRAARDSASFVLGVIAFCLGALMYYSVLYQSKLIPRWLSGWGLVGAALCMLAGVFVLFHLILPASTLHIVLNLPIALQEMVMAVWLIVKGFNPSVIASGSVKGFPASAIASESA
jgi:hypothetical protein